MRESDKRGRRISLCATMAIVVASSQATAGPDVSRLTTVERLQMLRAAAADGRIALVSGGEAIFGQKPKEEQPWEKAWDKIEIEQPPPPKPEKP